jgi:polyhydroxyalkanoate synthase subunit PhaC
MLADELIGASRDITTAWLDALGIPRPVAPPLAQTPRDEHPLDGGARLLHFRGTAPPSVRCPILLVPSLINRWYVLDLRPGASFVEALVGAGFDVWLLDWGIPAPEDRYLDWDSILRRLARATRLVQRLTAQPKLALLGYCMGGTLTTIHAAQHPDTLAALITLASPIDFSQGGMLRTMVDPSWFDADAIADAGNVAPSQMQAGFVALRPTLDASKLASFPTLATNPRARDAFLALEAWASDNIPFPAEAYRRYIRELYQQNSLAAGTHTANNRPVHLSQIRCPTLVITASRDAICPPAAATALLHLISSTEKATIEVPGGHVGAVVGSKAASMMYPQAIEWGRSQLTKVV